MNVFVVETPMELVSAIEARHHFPEGNSTLVVHSFYPKSLFLSMLEWAGWRGRVVFYKDKPVDWACPERTLWESARLRRTADKIIRVAGQPDYLFVNYFRSHMRHVINRVKYRNLILLEGGTDALSTSALRKMPMPEVADDGTLSAWRLIKTRIRRRHLDLDVRELPSVTFFSAYDLDLRPGDRLVRHNYSFVRQWAHGQRRTNEVYLLGQPLSEDGYMTRDCFIGYISRIRDYLGSNNVVFVPHPRQGDAVTREVVGRCGLAARRLALPIEIDMLFGKESPALLTGLWSSALGNCHALFGDSLAIKAFYIEPRDLLIKHDYVEDVYRYMAQQACRKFEVVRLDGDEGRGALTQATL